jgi:imidazoleglycerol phosphate dehydratase HisB
MRITAMNHPNEAEAATTSIKFNLNNDGELPFASGRTGFSDLLSLGALIHTARVGEINGKVCCQYETDLQGVKRAGDIATDALKTINDITDVIGYLMAYVDAKEVSDVMHRLGWVLVALAELRASLEIDIANIHYTHVALCSSQEKAECPITVN